MLHCSVVDEIWIVRRSGKNVFYFSELIRDLIFSVAKFEFRRQFSKFILKFGRL